MSHSTYSRLVICCLAFFGVNASGSRADEVAPQPASAKTREQVQEALQREVYGLSAERNQLLSAAIEAEPQASLPRWYQGQVQGPDGLWKSIDKPIAARDGQLYREYADLRNSKPDDAAGQKSLADWCGRNGLKQQERVHLIRSFMFNANQSDVRSRLDLVKVGNQWVEKSALAREQRRLKAAREAYEHWMPIITKLALQVTAADKEKRQAAIERVLAIHDPAALPVLQGILGVQGEDQALLVLQVADKMTDLTAIHLIAYLAAECPSVKVRKEAAQLLKSRDVTEYAPLLISEMYSPVETQVESKLLRNGSVALRQSFVREGADEFELLVADTRVSAFSAFRGFDARDVAGDMVRGVERAQTGARLAASATDIAVSEQNRNTKARNERIAAALVIATGEKLAAEPELWWKWWLDLNELEFVNGKSVDAQYHASAITVYNPQYAEPVPTPLQLLNRRLTGRKTSCLNAGTPIWTDQGPVAVERIKIGDLVLARDIETGELAYKPVLLTTVRPKRQLTEFSVGKDKIQATGGHLFWVSGKGWMRTRELQPSQVLHTAASPVNVGEVGAGNFAETYNLVVADFHTYFVGEQKLLSHDNSPRQPTRMIVPGLAAE